MKRRDLLAGLGVLAAWPTLAAAQSPGLPVIGFLGSESSSPWALYVDGFRRGLGETGYAEGRNVVIEFRWAEGNYERLPALAAELVRRQVNVLFATGAGGGARIAKMATSTIPIVITAGRDPVETGLVTSLGRPGGNITGVNFFTTELVEKRLEMLHALIPGATDIAFLVNPNGASHARLPDLEKTARTFGLRLRPLIAANAQQIDAAFAGFATRRPGALLVDADVYFNARREQIVALAARHAVPAIYDLRDYVVAGGLLSYGANLYEAYRLAGVYVGKILNGARPSDLPVVQSTRFELVINQRTAKELSLSIPQSLLLRADEVIQ